ncbi:hypothetical protein SDC9_79536 [bioreactor metagenome]|uniref:Uncharacterized protein n=1 Tax=bioreactor metagenome TaxID=1076179 RepID=A0A644YXD4_9ZZZZ
MCFSQGGKISSIEHEEFAVVAGYYCIKHFFCFDINQSFLGRREFHQISAGTRDLTGSAQSVFVSVDKEFDFNKESFSVFVGISVNHVDGFHLFVIFVILELVTVKTPLDSMIK